ncbi:MAG: adenine-specific methyltransferase EcoRI family protein, partial [Mycoplasmoidaceae bacterium]
MGRENLGNAKKNQNDEFYTKYETICKELRSDEYKKQLKGKVIYCNCDDAKHSEFWRYFV